jgi:hypothetical protein
MALLLPAILKLREAANRITCASHLRQIGIAFHNYHSDYGYLPDAGSYDSGNPPADRRDWGWAYDVLPYLEEGALHREPSNSLVRRSIIKIFYCPSRRAPGLYNGQAKCDYAGNGGTRVGSDGLDGLVIRGNGSLNTCSTNVRIGFRQGAIPDGCSNTVLLGEKLVNRPTMGGLGAGDDWTDNESWAGPGFADADIMRGCIRDHYCLPPRYVTPVQDTNDPFPADPLLNWSFGSSHPLLMNACFGDGSVRSIRYVVDDFVWRNACKRDDGHVLDLDDL